MTESGGATSYDEGLTAHMRGDFAEAISIFERVVEESPTSTAAYHQMGRCHMKLGDLKKAVECFEVAVRLGPDRIATRLDLGALLVATGEYSKAKAQYMRALKRSESNVKAMAGLGIAYFSEGDYGRAIAQLQSACGQNPSNFACHLYMARIHKALNNLDGLAEESLKSSSICQGLIRMRSEQPEGYYFLAETYVLQGETRGALRNYLIARDYSPKSAMHFFAFGLHYTRADNYLGIARCYEQMGEREYARYFGRLTLKLDGENSEAKRFASLML
jgi:tetratricopeptide (TPR) repeat protein